MCKICGPDLEYCIAIGHFQEVEISPILHTIYFLKSFERIIEYGFNISSKMVFIYHQKSFCFVTIESLNSIHILFFIIINITGTTQETTTNFTTLLS